MMIAKHAYYYLKFQHVTKNSPTPWFLLSSEFIQCNIKLILISYKFSLIHTKAPAICVDPYKKCGDIGTDPYDYLHTMCMDRVISWAFIGRDVYSHTDNILLC